MVKDNENFNSVEFRRIKIDEVGYNRFTMTPNKRRERLNYCETLKKCGIYDILKRDKVDTEKKACDTHNKIGMKSKKLWR